jgi:hypothetical protein
MQNWTFIEKIHLGDILKLLLIPTIENTRLYLSINPRVKYGRINVDKLSVLLTLATFSI